LAAARRILEDEGPQAFNTNRVAKEAGVGVGTLYEYFPDKDAIATRLQQDLSNAEADLVVERFAQLEDASFDVLLPALVELTFAVYRRHRPLRLALWAMAPGSRALGLGPAETRVLALIERRIE